MNILLGGMLYYFLYVHISRSGNAAIAIPVLASSII